MDLAAAGLTEQPFKTHGSPLSTVAYGAYRDALAVLEKTCKAPAGLSLLQGPSLSGKSVVLREFMAAVPDECSVAVIDGQDLNTQALLEALLRQFGYLVDFSSTSELMAMTRVFALQQASSHEPPIIIIENAHALRPSAWRTLAELAELRVRMTAAVKLVLVSDQPLRDQVRSETGKSMLRRLTEDFHLHPLTCEEAREYVHAKLRAAGSDMPEFIFPASICNELWRASGGWPGILDRVALLALARTETLPVGIRHVQRPTVPKGTWQADDSSTEPEDDAPPQAPPTLYVTHNGKTIRSLSLEQPRLLVGRSEHNDLAIESRFVSRHHLLLVRSGSATFLMDLNSTNGTFVNSRRVSNHVLLDDDVIAIGHHRIKFSDPYATYRDLVDDGDFADTAIMRTLEDMRSLLAKENTEIMPAATTEQLPTLGNQAG